MSVQNIFNNIISIMNEPNVDPSNEEISFHSFVNKKALKQKNYSMKNRIQLSGNDKVTRYQNEFKILYKEMSVENKLMSLSAFRDTCEQAMFDNKFNEKDILKILSETKIKPFLNIAKIYGLKLNGNILQLGKHTVANVN